MNEKLQVKPQLNKYVILRCANPDPPVIYNRKTHRLIVAQSCKVIEILKLCDGNHTIQEISNKTEIDVDIVYNLLQKVEKKGVINWG